jgi:hypothetical protein
MNTLIKQEAERIDAEWLRNSVENWGYEATVKAIHIKLASYAQSLQRPGGSDGWISEAELDAMTKEKDYWYNRCYHAEQFIEKSPCDPDIYDEQIIAHQQWQESKKR